MTDRSPPPTARTPARRRGDRRAWAIAAGASLGLHLAIFSGILFSRVTPGLPLPDPAPVIVDVSLVQPPPPPPPPAPAPDPSPPPGPAAEAEALAAAPTPAPTPPAAPHRAPPAFAPRPSRAPRPVPPTVPTVAAVAPATTPGFATVGAAQLSGALRAGSGSGGGAGGGGGGGGSGGSCDMVRRLQDALREDPDIQAAIAEAHRSADASGRALLIWNGDWIQNPGQEGKGLAGVRQAIAVEVAFAPRECRRQRVSGFALISLTEASTGPKVALGRGAWVWDDLIDRRR